MASGNITVTFDDVVSELLFKQTSDTPGERMTLDHALNIAEKLYTDQPVGGFIEAISVICDARVALVRQSVKDNCVKIEKLTATEAMEYGLTIKDRYSDFDLKLSMIKVLSEDLLLSRKMITDVRSSIGLPED